MNCEEAIAYIHSVSWKGSRPGLSRITELMHRLGDVQKNLKYIHIVGTNGKGSTAAMLSSVLQRAGMRTGMFTSPFILDFRERMQLNGEMISEDELAQVTAYVKPFAEAMDDHPTEFELITAIGLVWFAQKRCEIVVLEAGMGGALDSTNVIPAPEVAVFTNIGLDHTQILGRTAEEIAATKAGILKPGCEAVLYRNTPLVEAVIERLCAEKQIPLHKAKFDETRLLSTDLSGQRADFGHRKDLFIPLLGEHQLKNAAVALETIEVLRSRGWAVDEAAIIDGLARTSWPGRFEVLRQSPLFVLDGGHNPQCMDALTKAAAEHFRGIPLTVLTGVLADKDHDAMFPALAALADNFVTVTPPNPRALPAGELGAYLARFGKPVTVCESLSEGVRQAQRLAGENGGVLACGSLYMAGEIRSLVLQGKPASGR